MFNGSFDCRDESDGSTRYASKSMVTRADTKWSVHLCIAMSDAIGERQRLGYRVSPAGSETNAQCGAGVRRLSIDLVGRGLLDLKPLTTHNRVTLYPDIVALTMKRPFRELSRCI
jgi:hypothetical protein